MDHLHPSTDLQNAVQGVLALPWTEEMQESLVMKTFHSGFEEYANKKAIEALREEVGRKVVLVITKDAEKGRFSLQSCLDGSVSIQMSDAPREPASEVDVWREAAADELSDTIINIAAEAYVDQHPELITKLLQEAQERNKEYEDEEEWNDVLEEHITETNDEEIDQKQLVIDLVRDELIKEDVTTKLRQKLLPSSPEETPSDASPPSSEEG